MKKLMLYMFLFSACLSMAQTQQEVDNTVLISVNEVKLKAQINHDNSSNTIKLNSNNSGRLVLMYANAKNENEIHRRFFVVNEKGQELDISFKSRTVGIINVEISELLAKTQKGKLYKMYTLATPKDATVAATIRVKPILLTHLQIE